ncbi:uncharacterized protein PODANS_1_650 [Podospora anserina S mat+]|uniref:Podospora anserina S mat+ genomic DNA chromosome 1, supercontig 1 n=1 Tax=Podospora anserina (strain S / ATCC MYA-4624 / DSM 980 / FGSC 10383) TaxID=515849 RepID=B2A9D8_PODAN|nr:uncharacterized protein PODANS_1_650 [Podospora anserina S mat+]CAP59685.1 unnamed protein product [Podospora anserina S mat+]CDP22326.1 Putative protein of unknown function [Podospora anserina S mat+]
MRLLAGLTAAALSGLAAAASKQTADVYILTANQQSSSETPSIPKEVARHILLQRASRQPYGSDLRDIPSSTDTETAVSHIARFGTGPEPLFSQSDKTNVPQLVVILEGVTYQQSHDLKDALSQAGHPAAFRVSDAPSAAANKNLMTLFRQLGSAPSQPCDLAHALNPANEECWSGISSVVNYDLQKASSTYSALLASLPQINKLVAASDLEVTLLVLPDSTRSSKINSWSTLAGNPTNNRRRDSGERVITDSTVVWPAPSTPTRSAKVNIQKKAIPACFLSLDACKEATNDCSGHGTCVNKFGTGNATSSDARACFACKCMATVVRRGDEPGTSGKKTVHWGGNMCQKKDVSVPFWLITGFTVTIVGAVTFVIGLLFSVGQEQLPGVIGAGVSRGASK